MLYLLRNVQNANSFLKFLNLTYFNEKILNKYLFN